MRLSEIMSQMGLDAYPQVALALFFAAFVAIVLRTVSRARRGEYDRARHLPLEDDVGAAQTARGDTP